MHKDGKRVLECLQKCVRVCAVFEILLGSTRLDVSVRFTNFELSVLGGNDAESSDQRSHFLRDLEKKI